jgi:hypothetical protein
MNSLAKTHYWKHRKTEAVYTVNEKKISETEAHSVMLQCWNSQCDAAVTDNCDATVRTYNVMLQYKDTMWCCSTRIQYDVEVKGHTVLCCSTKTHNVMLQYKDTQCGAAVQWYTMWCSSIRLHGVLLQYKDTQCNVAVQGYTKWCCSTMIHNDDAIQGYTM